MSAQQEKIKNYIEQKQEQITTKIEKTPMEKFFVFFLILITVSALVLGYFQFKQNIEGPLQSSYLEQKRSEFREKYQVTNTNIPPQDESVTRLQNQDSDLDGLNDYSEIYVYQTSPYLEDSDSDGILDKQEITAGTDPNCPEGQECVNNDFYTEPAEVTPAPPSTNSNQITDVPLQDFLEIEQKLLSGEMSLSELGINDPQLEALLEEARQLEEANVDQLTDEEKQQAIQVLENLTPDQIRQELINRGVDPAVLEQVDDQTLKQMFLNALNLY